MSVKQKLLAVTLSVLFLGMAFFLLFTNYNEFLFIEGRLNNVNDKYLITETTYASSERYKIINIIFENEEVYAIVHLDNGNIKLIQFSEAYIEPTLKNILEGYLYRENGQIYIKAE